MLLHKTTKASLNLAQICVYLDLKDNPSSCMHEILQA